MFHLARLFHLGVHAAKRGMVATAQFAVSAREVRARIRFDPTPPARNTRCWILDQQFRSGSGGNAAQGGTCIPSTLWIDPKRRC
jgi:hypothetical protein